MCGIICALGNNEMINILLYGLFILKNRGYDSCGLCYIENTGFECIKHVSHESLKLIENELKTKTIDSSIGIAHTRWSTHGRVTKNNTHPHFDNKQRVAIVHNGIIENANELKKELQHLHYSFYSQTDTEVVAVLI